MDMDPRLHIPTLTEQLVQAILDDLRGGRLPLKLSIRELSERYGVSRTPVREACGRLADAGLLVIENNRGVRILATDPLDDVSDMFQIRLQLEVPATYRATARIKEDTLQNLESELHLMRGLVSSGNRARFMQFDTNFHEHILLAAGSERLALTVRKLREAAVTGRTLSKRPLSLLVEQHEDIVRALRAGDAACAAQAMYFHLWHSCKVLREELSGIAEAEPTPDESPWTQGFNPEAWRRYLTSPETKAMQNRWTYPTD